MQAVRLNHLLTSVGRSYFHQDGDVLDVGFGKEVTFCQRFLYTLCNVSYDSYTLCTLSYDFSVQFSLLFCLDIA